METKWTLQAVLYGRENGDVEEEEEKDEKKNGRADEKEKSEKERDSSKGSTEDKGL